MPDYQVQQNSTLTPSLSTSYQNSSYTSGLGSGSSSTTTSAPDFLSKNDYLNSSLAGATSSLSGSLNYGPKQPIIKQNNQAAKDLNNFNKATTSTGTKIGRGIGVAALNFIPYVGPLLAQFGSMAVDKMVDARRKQLEEKVNRYSQKNISQNPVDQLNSQNGLMMQGNNFAFGGSLEHYNLPKHNQLPDDFANAQMDGQGVQLEKNETMLKFPDGGNKSNKDYAFSPNLGFDRFGKPTINEKDVKVTFADASKKIEKTKTYGFDKANANSLKFKFENLKSIAEATREAKEGMQSFSNGGVNKYSDSGGISDNLREGNKQYYNPITNEFDFPNIPYTGSNSTYLKQLPVGSDKVITNPSKLTLNGTGLSYMTDIKNDNRKNKNNTNSYNLTDGDALQLAGSAVAPLANLAMYLGNKSEKVKSYLDNTKYSDPRIAKDYNPLYLAENAARKSIDDSSTSDSIRRANLVQLASNTAANAQDYSLKVDNTNKSLMMQRDNMLSGTNRFNAQARTERDDLQAQNDMKRQEFLTTGAGQLGQTLAYTGKFKNSNNINEIYGNILKNYSPDFYMDNKGNLVFKKKAKGGYLKLSNKNK